MTLIWNITYHELDTSWKGCGRTTSWKEEQKSWNSDGFAAIGSCMT
jgi:hypothetical protein